VYLSETPSFFWFFHEFQHVEISGNAAEQKKRDQKQGKFIKTFIKPQPDTHAHRDCRNELNSAGGDSGRRFVF
jgi:hypothetical protein